MAHYPKDLGFLLCAPAAVEGFRTDPAGEGFIKDQLDDLPKI